jgi:Dolichyl-phosphate-mannose-protein mannosyltransferase
VKTIERIYRPYALAVLALSAAIFVPRLLDLDTFVNIDGCQFWFDRSLEFYRQIRLGNFAGTLIAGHPGVTVMSMTGLSLIVAGLVKFHSLSLYAHFGELLYWAKFPIALVSGSAILLLVRVFRKRLDSALLAVCVGVFLAIDPWFLAHSRFLQLDATTSTFMLLCVVWLGLYADSLRWRDAAISGVFAGLAVLTKAYAGALVPFAFTVLLLTHLNSLRKRDIRGLASHLAIWSAAAGATFVVLWPAMWVAPFDTMLHLTGKAVFSMTHLHENVAPGNGLEQAVIGEALEADPAFNGELITQLLGQYTLVPLLLALPPIVLLFFRKWGSAKVRKMTACVLAFALFFAIGMSFFGRTSTRYMLVVCLAIDILAAIGLYQLLEVLRAKMHEGSGRLAIASQALLAIAVVGTAVSVFTVHPYYATYRNPVFDSDYKGWGEGLDMVARYFAQKSDVSDLNVASFYPCILLKISGCNAIPLDQVDAVQPDYIVFYKSQVDRQMYPEVTAAYLGDPTQQPEFVANIRGIDYAWVYKARPRPEAAVTTISQ